MNVISKEKGSTSELLPGLESWREVLLFLFLFFFFGRAWLSLFSYKNVPTGLVLRLTVLI